MVNKLFITCPFSNLETFLKSKYGNDIFFLNAPSAVMQLHEYEYLMRVREFIKQSSIRTIYIVNDTSCRFINGIINESKLFGLPSEKVLEELYIEHYFSDFKNQSVSSKKIKLAEFSIKNQANELINNTLIGNCISDFNIEIKGIITSKDKNLLKEINVDKNENKFYEL
jgi:hypothetical protein